MSYKNFSDFENIELKFGNVEQGLNYGYTASANFSYTDNPLFDNQFFLLFRRSEYAAQVELASAKIFQHLMSYGLEMEIVQEGEQFFVASRKIKNFEEGCKLIKNQEPSNIQGLMSLYVIWYFIGQTDTHSGNYGLADRGEEKWTFGLDMAEALDFKMLGQPLELSALKQIPYFVEGNYEGVCEDTLPTHFVASDAFQNEKLAMMKKIAETPFEILETIIRETITSSFSVHQKIMLEKCLLIIDEASRESTLAAFKQEQEKDYSVDALIQILKCRHDQWKLLVQQDSLVQDYYFANPSTFWAESDRYHACTSSDSDSRAEDNELNINKYNDFLFFNSDRDESQCESSLENSI